MTVYCGASGMLGAFDAGNARGGVLFVLCMGYIHAGGSFKYLAAFALVLRLTLRPCFTHSWDFLYGHAGDMYRPMPCSCACGALTLEYSPHPG